jgi:adhesin HecA-like repeat protein
MTVTGGVFGQTGSNLSGGTLTFNSASLDVTGPVTLAAAMKMNLTSSSVTGTGTVINAGTIAAQNFTFDADLVNQGLLDTYRTTANAINGAFYNEFGATLRLRGDAYYSTAQRYSAVVIADGFTNAGRIELLNFTTQYNWYVTQTTLTVTSGVLVNAPTGVIQVYTPYSHSSTQINGSIDNQGVMNIQHSAVLDQPGTTFTNSGTVNVTGGGLTIDEQATINNSGLIEATGANIAITDFTTGVNTGSILTPGGALTIAGFGSLDNSGDIRATGGTFTLSGYTTLNNTGDIEIGAGRALNITGGTINQQAGTLGGDGTVNASSATIDVTGTWTPGYHDKALGAHKRIGHIGPCFGVAFMVITETVVRAQPEWLGAQFIENFVHKLLKSTTFHQEGQALQSSIGNARHTGVSFVAFLA